MLLKPTEKRFRFNYPSLKQINHETGRKYQTPDGSRLPSVTTILSKTSDQTKIIEWRQRVGAKEAQDITNFSTGIGTILHNQIENFLNGDLVEFPRTIKGRIANQMFDTMKERVLDRIEQIVGIEVQLYMEGLWAGSTDCVAVIDGELIIGDYKNSKEIKPAEWCEDYFLQLTAYRMAHENMFPHEKIKSLRVFMVSHPINKQIGFREYVITPDQFDHYEDLWLDRVEQYYANFG